MNWKPSKRQTLLRKRLINSSQTYWETAHQLNQMLLKMLHHDNIYTPDDLHNWYMNSQINSRPSRIIPLKNDRQQSKDQRVISCDKMNHALINLSHALTQLRNVINKNCMDKNSWHDN